MRNNMDFFNNDYLDCVQDFENRLHFFHLSQEAKGEGYLFDIFNCEKFFISSFLTDEMEEDFPLITSIFLKNEGGDVEKYMDMEYVSAGSTLYRPAQNLCYMYLNAMYRAYKDGSVTAKDLLVYLYKTYHKQEYNRLKKYHDVKFQDLFLISDLDKISADDTPLLGMRSMSRVLCMAKILGVEVSRDCEKLYLLADDYIDELEQIENSFFEEQQQLFDRMDEDGLMEACYDEAAELLDYGDEMIHYEQMAAELSTNILLTYGYPSDYLLTMSYEANTAITSYREAIMQYYLVAGDFSYNMKEIAFVNILCRVMDVLLQNITELKHMCKGTVNNAWYRDVCAHEVLFRPESLPQRTVGTVSNPALASDTKNTTLPKEDVSVILNELADLRNRLHMSESTVKQLKNQAIEVNHRLQVAESENNGHREERKELIALREYVYNMTEREDSAPSLSTDAMKKALAEKSVLIVGGHTNWVGKLKNEFPNWKFVAPNVSNTVNVSLIQNADKVYFFTDTLGHSNYHKFLNSIREQEVPFGYIHGVNIAANIQYLYNDLCSND